MQWLKAELDVTKRVVCVTKFRTLHRSSYIATPKYLANKHCIINVENDDLKCRRRPFLPLHHRSMTLHNVLQVVFQPDTTQIRNWYLITELHELDESLFSEAPVDAVADVLLRTFQDDTPSSEVRAVWLALDFGAELVGQTADLLIQDTSVRYGHMQHIELSAILTDVLDELSIWCRYSTVRRHKPVKTCNMHLIVIDSPQCLTNIFYVLLLSLLWTYGRGRWMNRGYRGTEMHGSLILNSYVTHLCKSH